MKRPLRSWLWRVPLDQEVDEELAFHLEMRTRELVARGMEPGAAREAALGRLGDVDRLRQICVDIARKRDREMRLTQWIEEWRDDVRFAGRQLLRAPGFALVAAVTLALGIGATTAIFSVVHAVVLRPFAFAEPERVMVLGEDRDGRLGGVSGGNFNDWRTRSRSFTALAALYESSFNLADGDTPERVVGARATASYFTVIGLAPRLGRAYTDEEDAPGREQVVVLSHRLWTRRFGSDPAVVNRDIRLNGVSYTVVGVMPAAFDEIGAEELWVPAAFTPERLATRDEHFMTVYGRLAPGVTPEEAQAELRAIFNAVRAEFPNDHEAKPALVDTFSSVTIGAYQPRLLVLLGAVTLVLLIACGNVANLLLARGGVRAREIALRAAIGAGRGRIVRQLLTETLVLALAGAALGVGVAWAAVPALIAASPEGVPRLDQTRIDGLVLVFALAAACFSAVVAGLAPALRAARSDLRATLHDGGRTGTTGRDGVRLVLVAGEVGLAIVLLVGAGLLVRSAMHLQRVDLGFDLSGVSSARLTLPASGYDEPERVVQTLLRLVETVSASPGIEAAAVTTGAPMTPGGGSNGLMPNAAEFDEKSLVQSLLGIVTPDYFRAMRIPLRRGRLFTPDDRRGTQRVMIVSETTARQLFPGEDPIGRVVGCCEMPPNGAKVVVGVVGDVRSRGPETDSLPQFYLPIEQAPDIAWDWVQRSVTVVARSRTGDAAAAIPALRGAMQQIDPAVPLYSVASMDQRLRTTLAHARFNTMLMALLGGFGLLLAAIGVYGVISYFVAQRQHEIGIRMALGAKGPDVVRMVVFQGMQPVVVGMLFGVAAAWGASRLLAAYVHGVTTTDPLTFALVVLLLTAVALAATAVPARRAVRVDPTKVLNSV
jgi:predicted permease